MARLAAPNRAGNRDTGTREKILDATAEIMLEEGYAAATSRRVAERVGVQRAVVYYYFPTMDDLYLAVLRRGTEMNLDVQRRALASDKPLHELWDMTIDSRGSRLTMEFMALGNHRKAIRAELAAGAQRSREAQIAALTFILRDHGLGDTMPPDVVAVLLASIGLNPQHRKPLGYHHRTPQDAAVDRGVPAALRVSPPAHRRHR